MMSHAEQCEHTACEAADRLEAAAKVLEEVIELHDLTPGLEEMAGLLRENHASPILIRFAEAIVGRRG